LKKREGEVLRDNKKLLEELANSKKQPLNEPKMQMLQRELELLISTRGQEKEASISEISKMQEELRNSLTEIANLRAELFTVKEEAKDLNGLKEELREELEMKQTELARVKEKQKVHAMENEHLKDKLKDKTNRTEDLESILNEKNIQIESLYNELNHNKDEVNRLKTENVKLEDKLLEIEKAQTKAKTIAIQRLEEENKELRLQVNQESIELEIVKTELDRTRLELSNTKREAGQVVVDNESILQKAISICKETGDMCNKELIPLIEDNENLYGSELQGYILPRVSNQVGGIVKWADAFKKLIVLLIRSIRECNKQVKEKERKLVGDNEKLQHKLREIQLPFSMYLARLIIVRSKSFEFTKRSMPEEEKAKLNELSERNKRLQEELKDWKAIAENSIELIKDLERKAMQANSEKHDLELLLAR